VLPLIGLSAVALIATMGLAVDTGRALLVHSKLLTSADASGLAIGARLSTSDMNAEARKFVDANFPAGYAGATVTGVSASANADGSVITVNATATMPTTLLQLVGVNSVDLDVVSEVTRGVAGLELVLALDNTGSMYGQKLAALKTASKDLLDIVFGEDDVADKLYVGIVPFSQSVNIGKSRSGWLRGQALSDLDWGPTEWAGCVEAQHGFTNAQKTATVDTTDMPPSARKLNPYYWPDDANNDWKKGNGQYNVTWYSGPNLLCPAEVTPMTSSKSKLTAAVDKMQAVGWTYINLGASWAWRMLSPNWRGEWGGDMNANDLPLDYNTVGMSKAVVIMTDGDHEISPDWYGAYGYLSEKRLKTKNKEAAEAEMDSRLKTVCTNMKNNNIIVYTVVFGTLTQTTEEMMRDCATQPDFYFSSPTAADLKTAFKTIGDSLANLRVSR